MSGVGVVVPGMSRTSQDVPGHVAKVKVGRSRRVAGVRS